MKGGRRNVAGETVYDQRFGSVRRGPRERRGRTDFRHSGRRKSRYRRIHPPLLDPADPDPPRAGSGLHGRHLWQAHRQAGCVHHHPWPRRAQSFDGFGLCAARRDADDHDHRPEGHPVIPAGALSDRRHRRGDEAADQAAAACISSLCLSTIPKTPGCSSTNCASVCLRRRRPDGSDKAAVRIAWAEDPTPCSKALPARWCRNP